MSVELHDSVQETNSSVERVDPRIERSRAAIADAAFARFAREGYAGTSVDDIAADARVSKRTVYNIYGGKEQLFRELLSEAIETAERFSGPVAASLGEAPDAAEALSELAVGLARAVLGGRIVALRRLLIGEAERFGDLALEYYERAPGRVLRTLAAGLRRLDERGLLAVEDPDLAAEQFAFLVMGAPLDRALFTSAGEPPADEAIAQRALAGARVFLRAYAR